MVGTAEGQVKLLSELGITESSVSAPIVSSMNVISSGRLEPRVEVFVSMDVLEAVHSIVIEGKGIHYPPCSVLFCLGFPTGRREIMRSPVSRSNSSRMFLSHSVSSVLGKSSR